MSYRIVIIAALEREVAPLVKGWRVLEDDVPAVYRKFVDDDVIVVCAGVGSRAAKQSAEGAFQIYEPDLFVSAGLAGGLTTDLRIGDTIVPSTVISAETGEQHVMGHGSGVLITCSGVAGMDAKRILARQYGAQLVDMEAAAVAQVAKKNGVSFAAVKAISDEAEFDLPDLEPFVDAQGKFLTGRFVAHFALRPRLWGTVRTLARNSSRASMELCTVLRNRIEEWKQETGVIAGNSAIQGKGSRSK